MPKFLLPLFFILLFCSAALTQVNAQELKLPLLSPESIVTQNIGLNTYTVDYFRPSSHGRIIWGKLVPYGQVWRTGANGCTKISFSTDVLVAGQAVAAGTYALFTIPGEEKWTVILNKNTALQGTDGYDPKLDLLRFTVNPNTSEYTETFTINFSGITENSVLLDLRWDQVRLSFPIQTDVLAQVKKQVGLVLGNNWTEYAQAADYFTNKGIVLDTALDYAQKSIALKPDAWNYNIKSRILAKQNNYTGAVAAAEESLRLAQLAKDDFYAKQAQDNLAAWRPQVPVAPVKGKGKKG